MSRHALKSAFVRGGEEGGAACVEGRTTRRGGRHLEPQPSCSTHCKPSSQQAHSSLYSLHNILPPPLFILSLANQQASYTSTSYTAAFLPSNKLIYNPLRVMPVIQPIHSLLLLSSFSKQSASQPSHYLIPSKHQACSSSPY